MTFMLRFCCLYYQCESTELKLLIQRVLAVEKYVKDKQNQTGAQPCMPPTPQVTAKPGVKICPTTPAPPQGSKAPPPQPPKAAAPPVTPPGQGQAGAAPAVPAGLPQKPNTPPVQPAKPAAPPVSSPVPVPGQSQPALAPAVPAGSPQVLWGSPAPPPVATPLSSPIGLTIQSTLETPGTFLGGNGQVDIQVRENSQHLLPIVSSYVILSHFRISPTDSKVRTTLYSIINSSTQT